jgi:hypothetical protein
MIERRRSHAAALAVLACLALLPARARGAGKVPDNLPTGVQPEASLRVFERHEPWLLHAEVYASSQTDSRAQYALLAGSYYRLLDNLKVGAFYLAETGVRHDADWFKDPADGTWKWANTNGRVESNVVLDASPRAELGFLPGGSWVGELKLRYFYDLFDSEQSLLARPGLTYFWLREGRPFLNFFLQYEMWFPLNFGHRAIYDSWAYLGALYHLSPVVQLGGYTAYRQQWWSSTQAYTNLTGQTYTVEGDAAVLGLLCVVQVGI